MRKDSYLVETRKFANVPCGAFCVLFCPDFPVKSSQYFFYLYFFDSYQFMGFFCICFSLCSFLLTFCCQFWDCSVFFWPHIDIWNIISLSQHPLSWASGSTAVSRWILKSTQGTVVTVVKWWKLVLSKPQQLPSLWDNACCWMSCLTCGHLNARHCAVSIQVLAAPSKPPDVWRSQLASAPLFICRIPLISEKEAGSGNISRGSTVLLWGHLHQSYTVQQWSPIFMLSDSKAEGWLTWPPGNGHPLPAGAYCKSEWWPVEGYKVLLALSPFLSREWLSFFPSKS